MTLALDRTDGEPPLPALPALKPCVGVNAGRSVPATALKNRVLSAWVRSHGVSVTARDDHDLDVVRYHNIKAVQVVFRCGAGTGTSALCRAVALGISRFVVSTPAHMARISECAHSTKYLYLDDEAPLIVGDRRLKVIGLHSDVADYESAAAWVAAAQRLICRAAVLKACGSTIKRITLSGGSTQLWSRPDDAQARLILNAVDCAVSAECLRWQLVRPAITLSPQT